MMNVQCRRRFRAKGAVKENITEWRMPDVGFRRVLYPSLAIPCTECSPRRPTPACDDWLHSQIKAGMKGQSVTGDVKVNGENMSGTFFLENAAYVPQEDRLWSALTGTSVRAQRPKLGLLRDAFDSLFGAMPQQEGLLRCSFNRRTKTCAGDPIRAHLFHSHPAPR